MVIKIILLILFIFVCFLKKYYMILLKRNIVIIFIFFSYIRNIVIKGSSPVEIGCGWSSWVFVVFCCYNLGLWAGIKKNIHNIS